MSPDKTRWRARLIPSHWTLLLGALLLACAAITGVHGPEYRPTTTANADALDARNNGGRYYAESRNWLGGALRIEVGNTNTATKGAFHTTDQWAGIVMEVEVINGTQTIVQPSLHTMVLIDDRGRTWTVRGFESTDLSADDYNLDVHPGTTRSWHVGFSRDQATLNDLPQRFRVRLGGFAQGLGTFDGEFNFTRIEKQ